MFVVKLTLNTLDKVKDFVSTADKCNFRIDIKQQHYTVNAKSILGMLSLDITKPVIAEFNSQLHEEKAFALELKLDPWNGEIIKETQETLSTKPWFSI